MSFFLAYCLQLVCCILVCMFMQHTYIYILDTYRRNDKETQDKDARNDKDARRKASLAKYIYLSLYCKGSKRVVWGSTVIGSWRSNRTEIFWPPNLWPSRCVFLVLLMLNRSPGVHSAGCWLSLLHLISIFSGPQFIRAPSPFGLVWLSLPHLVSNWLQLNSAATRTQLAYIIVRRPLDLWNRMFNRHQAEITVMQFRGHSLPVHQSMSVPWEFFSSSYFISQFPSTRFPLITAIRMCHLLPVHHLGMTFLAGSKYNRCSFSDLNFEKGKVMQSRERSSTLPFTSV